MKHAEEIMEILEAFDLTRRYRESQDESGRRRRGGGDSLAHLTGPQRLDDAVAVLADLDAAGGVAEDRAVALAEGDQRAEGDDGVASLGSVHRGENSEDVVAGDLTRVW